MNMVYHHRSILSQKVILSINSIGGDTNEIIEKMLQDKVEGKCITEGYVKRQSLHIISISSGQVVDGDRVRFVVLFECDIYLPVEGMLIQCVVKNVTKAGIRAELETSRTEDIQSPFVIFIARDNNTSNDNVIEGQSIEIRVLGQRFELNDSYISIIGELVPHSFGK